MPKNAGLIPLFQDNRLLQLAYWAILQLANGLKGGKKVPSTLTAFRSIGNSLTSSVRRGLIQQVEERLGFHYGDLPLPILFLLSVANL
jgi:hypothetical protein